MNPRVTSNDVGIDYLIIVQSREFLLKDSELRSEPGNALIEPLTRADASRDPQRHLRRVSVHTEPNLFSLIHAHLKGFEIFPLSSQGIPLFTASNPVYLGKEATLKNLLRDAEDFGMMDLCAKIRREMAGSYGLETPSRSEPDAPPVEILRDTEYRLVINRGGWAEWDEPTMRGTPISQSTKEAILLKLINSDIVITGTSMPIPQGYRLVAAWDEYPSTGNASREQNTKSFVLFESI